MSISLNASGHVPATDPAAPDSAPQSLIELELYDALRAVLTNPKYGVVASSFGGSHVSGSLHLPDDTG